MGYILVWNEHWILSRHCIFEIPLKWWKYNCEVSWNRKSYTCSIYLLKYLVHRTNFHQTPINTIHFLCLKFNDVFWPNVWNLKQAEMKDWEIRHIWSSCTCLIYIGRWFVWNNNLLISFIIVMCNKIYNLTFCQVTFFRTFSADINIKKKKMLFLCPTMPHLW